MIFLVAKSMENGITERELVFRIPTVYKIDFYNNDLKCYIPF